MVVAGFFFPIFAMSTAIGLAYASPAAAAVGLLVALLIYLKFVHWVFVTWENSFRGTRVTRCNTASPSHHQMPGVKA